MSTLLIHRARCIATQDDVQRLRGAGVQAFLVGEAFMRADEPGAALAQLFPTLCLINRYYRVGAS